MKPAKKPISKSSVREAFRTIIWPRRKLIAIGLVLIVASRIASMVTPGTLQYLIDTVLESDDSSLLWQYVALVSSAVFVQATTGFLLTRILSVEAQHLRCTSTVNILAAPMNWKPTSPSRPSPLT